jgi:F-type H+-transporting ATPase subunit delta
MKSKKQAKREAKKLFRLCVVNGVPDDDRIRQIAQRVAAAGYRECPAILTHFLRLVRYDRFQRTAVVESAAALAPELQTAIQANLLRRYGPGLETAFSVRPSLIGGVRIQVGSNVYDGTVRAGLAALEKSF